VGDDCPDEACETETEIEAGTETEVEAGETTHAVTLEWPDGRTETLAVGAGETVLAAAERDELGLPFGCLTGACATCVGHVERGALDHRRAPRGLKERQVEEGYSLLCVAVPRSDCRVRVGTAVGRELVANPWR
jgi:ferredoxin